jgi:hypothetical protein
MVITLTPVVTIPRLIGRKNGGGDSRTSIVGGTLSSVMTRGGDSRLSVEDPRPYSNSESFLIFLILHPGIRHYHSVSWCELYVLGVPRRGHIVLPDQSGRSLWRVIIRLRSWEILKSSFGRLEFWMYLMILNRVEPSHYNIRRSTLPNCFWNSKTSPQVKIYKAAYATTTIGTSGSMMTGIRCSRSRLPSD